MKELSVSARITKITKILNDIKIDMKPNSVMCLMIENGLMTISIYDGSFFFRPTF